MRAQPQRYAVECSGRGIFHRSRAKDMVLGRNMYSSRQKGKMIYYTQVVKPVVIRTNVKADLNNISQMSKPKGECKVAIVTKDLELKLLNI